MLRSDFKRFDFALIFTFVFIFAKVDSLHSNCVSPSCVSLTLEAAPQEILVSALEGGLRKLCILCYHGQRKTLFKLWLNPKITINLPDPEQEIEVFYGQNVSEIVDRSRAVGFLKWTGFSLIVDQYSFDPFNSSCIGISSVKNYTVNFTINNPEIRFLVYLIVGLLLFFFASSWSQHALLYYSTGVTIGILGSVIIAVFILSRFLPQKLKTLGYTIALISTSTSLYLWRLVSVYLNDILLNHWQYVIGYVLVAGVLSFAFVYRYGPATNSRTMDLVRWSLQALGLVLVYQSSQIAEMSIALIAVSLCVYFLPMGFASRLNKLRFRYFPPKVRLLTEEEYYLEAEVETKKALDQLKEYCRSPNCDAWKTMSRLTSPNKFASFIDGGSHVTDEEYREHDYTAEVNPLRMEDDSSDDDTRYR
ncbi:nuclear envelope integral membrane protein 1-like [Physella acuta]|uniref:nuclear envelope integral membrane protein 1-like n=1 Tax=Physella acuta TaxID=109671 RepID=UPI0027DD52AE|nr:nuclear envelope integral membrane protein 1-like [Physella acuta]